MFHEFETTQLEIETVSNDADEVNAREAIENDYFSLLAKAKQLLSDAQPIVTKTSEVSSRASSSSSGSRGARRYNARVKLPVIDLPKFSGVYSKWLEFYDSFNAIIQNNHDLEDI